MNHHYVIRNSDGKLVAEYPRFTPFPLPRRYATERAAREAAAELEKAGHYGTGLRVEVEKQ